MLTKTYSESGADLSSGREGFGSCLGELARMCVLPEKFGTNIERTHYALVVKPILFQLCNIDEAMAT